MVRGTWLKRLSGCQDLCVRRPTKVGNFGDGVLVHRSRFLTCRGKVFWDHDGQNFLFLPLVFFLFKRPFVG